MLMRFWSKVEFTEHCWLWTAGKHNTNSMPLGYGRFRVKTYVMQAHRLAYELIRAVEIPADLVIDHRVCRNTLCVNPDHMEVVTQVVNAQRQVKIPITHCRRGGHEYTEANTYVNPGSGYRLCRSCIKDRR
jgi:hypothetical protein